MDLSSFQRKTILILFIAILTGAVLLARKEPLKIPLEKKQISNESVPVPQAININTADINLLSTLPGIGPGIARQIIDYRTKCGPITCFEQLEDIPGIGEKKTEQIRDKISFGNIPKQEPITKEQQGKINLNTASAADLMKINGIGPKLSKAIIDYRDKNGPFTSIDDLTNVPRIGEKTLERLKEYLYVEKCPPTETAPNTVCKKEGIKHYTTGDIDLSLKCPHCGKTLWEEGKKKRIYIRCPHCLKEL